MAECLLAPIAVVDGAWYHLNLGAANGQKEKSETVNSEHRDGGATTTVPKGLTRFLPQTPCS